jgi:hypothetical protein
VEIPALLEPEPIETGAQGAPHPAAAKA